MCRRWQLEVTMILDIRKEKQHLINYKIHGTDNPKQSFEVRNMWYDYTDNIWIRDLLINNLKDNFGQTLIPVKLLLTVVKMSRDPFVNTSFCLYQSISNNIKRKNYWSIYTVFVVFFFYFSAHWLHKTLDSWLVHVNNANIASLASLSVPKVFLPVTLLFTQCNG